MARRLGGTRASPTVIVLAEGWTGRSTRSASQEVAEGAVIPERQLSRCYHERQAR